MSPAFHALEVAGVDPLCDDAVAITFDVPAPLAEDYRFTAGQSVTLRRWVDGREERRSYSVCSPEGGPLRIGVRVVPGGLVSGWLAGEVLRGERIDVQPPAGRFTPEPGRPAFHVLVAAGSGITPILSIASSVLAHGEARAVLLYGNRRADSVMFADELADLKDAHLTRLQVVHVLSRESHEVELFSGRIDGDRLRRLLPVIGPVAAVDHWWLCGPHPMVTGVAGALDELGVPRARVRRELFYVEDRAPAPAPHREPTMAAARTVTTIVDGRATTTTAAPGVTVLESALAHRPDLPFACRGGVCGTCRAKVTSGEVRMRRNFALELDELDAGFVLTCQSIPTTDEVVVDFDA